jgi:hypothetical protein
VEGIRLPANKARTRATGSSSIYQERPHFPWPNTIGLAATFDPASCASSACRSANTGRSASALSPQIDLPPTPVGLVQRPGRAGPGNHGPHMDVFPPEGDTVIAGGWATRRERHGQAQPGGGSGEAGRDATMASGGTPSTATTRFPLPFTQGVQAGGRDGHGGGGDAYYTISPIRTPRTRKRGTTCSTSSRLLRTYGLMAWCAPMGRHARSRYGWIGQTPWGVEGLSKPAPHKADGGVWFSGNNDAGGHQATRWGCGTR